MNNDKHVTIRVALVGFFVTIVLVAIVGGAVYTGHQNTVKVTRYGVTCMENGGEFRANDSNTTATCDK